MRNLVPFIQFSNVKNTYGGVIFLLKLQVPGNLFFPHRCFFTFFKLLKWYQISQSIKYVNIIKILHVCLCSLQYLEFTVTFTLFCLFNLKLADLMIFSVLKAKCTRPKNRTHLRGFSYPNGSCRPEILEKLYQNFHSYARILS